MHRRRWGKMKYKRKRKRERERERERNQSKVHVRRRLALIYATYTLRVLLVSQSWRRARTLLRTRRIRETEIKRETNTKVRWQREQRNDKNGREEWRERERRERFDWLIDWSHLFMPIYGTQERHSLYIRYNLQTINSDINIRVKNIIIVIAIVLKNSN